MSQGKGAGTDLLTYNENAVREILQKLGSFSAQRRPRGSLDTRSPQIEGGGRSLDKGTYSTQTMKKCPKRYPAAVVGHGEELSSILVQF